MDGSGHISSRRFGVPDHSIQISDEGARQLAENRIQSVIDAKNAEIRRLQQDVIDLERAKSLVHAS